MSNWTHDLLVIVPETLIYVANALAESIGTSDADSETFRSCDFAVKIVAYNTTTQTNEDGEQYDSVEKAFGYGTERYAVANTRAVDQIMDYFALVPAELSVNVVFPVITGDVITGGDMTKIQVFVDQDPFYVLDLLGLAPYEYFKTDC